MTATFSVNVSNISAATTEANLHDFFTFCGKIVSIDYNQAAHTASVHFEKASAAKTALMLNGGTLDASHLNVTSDTVEVDAPEQHHDAPPHPDGAPDQSVKPRAGIAAEYLARGYKLSDNILQRAIDLDTKHGISTQFVSYMRTLDSSIGSRAIGPDKKISDKVQESLIGAQAKAKEVDERKGFSRTANDYYTKALQHPLGQKIFSFYTTTTKRVSDIHDEARRIADHHKTTAATTAPAAPQAHASTESASQPPADVTSEKKDA